MAYIYCIENLLNHKKYVGETNYSISIRWKEHQRAARNNQILHRPLYHAIQKYGIENFIIYQLEECSSEERWKREQFWIQKLDSYTNGYNATLGGDGSPSIEWNDEDFIMLYESKKSPQEIADYFNCCLDSVTKRAKALNLKFLGWSQRHDIIMYDLDNNYCKSFYSAGEASRWIIENDFSKAQASSVSINIMRCCKHQRKTAYGFKWEFL